MQRKKITSRKNRKIHRLGLLLLLRDVSMALVFPATTYSRLMGRQTVSGE